MVMVEPVSDVAKSALEGMKTAPSCIALVLLAGGALVATYFAMQAERARQHEETMALYAQCYDAKARGGPPNE